MRERGRKGSYMYRYWKKGSKGWREGGCECTVV